MVLCSFGRKKLCGKLEFNRLMLDFYRTGDQKAMNSFLRSSLDEKIINIMKEEQIHGHRP
ncbi:MAG: hypothetical protein D3915_13380 [Candidatus Electrothrix sp. AU1_5]|nr:hypothetical protein [Candidatus Electrothrix gigas]MCI5194095.1 hypothetical protein [Candidatus Electrothrix gigas]